MGGLGDGSAVAKQAESQFGAGSTAESRNLQDGEAVRLPISNTTTRELTPAQIRMAMLASRCPDPPPVTTRTWSVHRSERTFANGLPLRESVLLSSLPLRGLSLCSGDGVKHFSHRSRLRHGIYR